MVHSDACDPGAAVKKYLTVRREESLQAWTPTKEKGANNGQAKEQRNKTT